ncbi:unnamed protein product [Caretta caretta]
MTYQAAAARRRLSPALYGAGRRDAEVAASEALAPSGGPARPGSCCSRPAPTAPLPGSAGRHIVTPSGPGSGSPPPATGAGRDPPRAAPRRPARNRAMLELCPAQLASPPVWNAAHAFLCLSQDSSRQYLGYRLTKVQG